MLIGATARDLILARGYGLRSTRATLDVDIAVRVDGWSDYEALKVALVEQDGALEDPNRRHRVILPGALQLDLVPFGGVEADGMVAWPPDSDPRMNVLGLTEVFERPVMVRLPGGLELRAPSVHGYLALKLLAWLDRHDAMPRRDAVDIADLMTRAGAFVALEVLYDDHFPQLEVNDFDPHRAALEVLGARMSADLRPRTRASLVELLNRETDESGRLELVRDMRAGSSGLAQLRSLLRGLVGN